MLGQATENILPHIPVPPGWTEGPFSDFFVPNGLFSLDPNFWRFVIPAYVEDIILINYSAPVLFEQDNQPIPPRNSAEERFSTNMWRIAGYTESNNPDSGDFRWFRPTGALWVETLVMTAAAAHANVDADFSEYVGRATGLSGDEILTMKASRSIRHALFQHSRIRIRRAFNVVDTLADLIDFNTVDKIISRALQRSALYKRLAVVFGRFFSGLAWVTTFVELILGPNVTQNRIKEQLETLELDPDDWRHLTSDSRNSQRTAYTLEDPPFPWSEIYEPWVNAMYWVYQHCYHLVLGYPGMSYNDYEELVRTWDFDAESVLKPKPLSEAGRI